MADGRRITRSETGLVDPRRGWLAEQEFRWGVRATLAVVALLICVFLFYAACAGSVQHDLGERFALWANAATVFGIAAAGVTIVLALVSYEASQTLGRQAHMHGLFRDFLRFEAEFAEKNDRRAAADEEARAEVGLPLADKLGFRLYTMEEMWAWIRAEEAYRALRWRILGEPDAIVAWRRTVRTHVVQVNEPASDGATRLWRHLDRYADCYGADFLRQLTSWCPDLAPLVQDEFEQRRAADRGERRPFEAEGTTGDGVG